MAEASQKRLSMIVFSGDLDKLFAAFSIAGGAAASGLEVVMFFTFWGLRALKKKKPTGRTLFGRMLGRMYGGDIERSAPSRMNFGGIGRWMFKKMMKAKNVTSVPELRKMAIDLGVKMYGCQMSMEVMEIPKEKLLDEVAACVGVAFFLEQAQQSDVSLFI